MQPAFDWSKPCFDGVTFQRERDGARLHRQLAAVKACLGNGAWWTLRHLAIEAGGSEASISARIRDLRKQKFGGYLIERRHVSGGLWEYRMTEGGQR